MGDFSLKVMRFLVHVGSRGDITSVFVIILVGFIILPLPTFLLDFFLVVNIVLALIVLLRGLSLSEPMKLFAFPTILLFATLFRLALNVSSTRLILLHGIDSGLSAAGQVIGSFGSFVVRGDFVVGCVIFLLIAVVNFVVIAKGSARVAEVAARFVLDALPGKQLAIDADLRAGLLTQEQASLRRETLVQESRFYGAMDGAMKFVQGDAIAGLAIVFINAIGGVGLGTYRGMPFSEAVEVFGVLAIGDGLVNIIPSLLMSLSAGVIVTHVSGGRRRGSGGEMFVQLASEPSALIFAGLALVFAALLPGVPFVPFAAVGFCILAGVFSLARLNMSATNHSAWPAAALSSLLLRRFETAESSAALPWEAAELPILPENASGSQKKADKLGSFQELECIYLDVSESLYASYFLGKTGASDSFEDGVEQLAAPHWQVVLKERGVRLPPLRVVSRKGLSVGEYAVNVRGKEVRKGRLERDHIFVTLSPGSIVALGVPVHFAGVHPIDRRIGAWVNRTAVGLDAIHQLGAQVLSEVDFLLQDCVAAALEVVQEIFGLDEVKRMISELREEHVQLVEEVFDKGIVSYPEFTEILRRLVRERVNVCDLKLIVEGVSEFSALHADIEERVEWLDELHSFLRIVLARGILQEAMRGDESLRVFLLSSELEDEFREAAKSWTSRRNRPPLDPEIEGKLCDTARKMFHPVIERGNLPVVVLCSNDIRHAAQEFFIRQLGAAEWLRTLSYQELGDGINPESVGVLRC